MIWKFQEFRILSKSQQQSFLDKRFCILFLYKPTVFVPGVALESHLYRLFYGRKVLSKNYKLKRIQKLEYLLFEQRIQKQR